MPAVYFQNTLFKVAQTTKAILIFAGYTKRDMRTLADLPLRKKTVVLQIKESALKPKLLEMGLYTGKTVEVLFRAPFGDPIAVDVDGYVLSMRLDEANQIEIAD